MIAARQLADAIRSALPGKKVIESPLPRVPGPPNGRTVRRTAGIKRHSEEREKSVPAEPAPVPEPTPEITLDWLKALRAQAVFLKVLLPELGPLGEQVIQLEQLQVPSPYTTVRLQSSDAPQYLVKC